MHASPVPASLQPSQIFNMLSTDGKWKLTPRLHSVKFVFDAPIPADAKSPDEIFFDNPFPAEIPGVPKRFVFKTPTTHDFDQEVIGLQTSTKHNEDGLDANVPYDAQASDVPESKETLTPSTDSRTKITSGESQPGSVTHLRGPTCDALDDMESIVCSAWALILSSFIDSEIVNFDVCVSSSDNPQPTSSVTPVIVSIDTQISISAFLQQIKDNGPVSESVSQGLGAFRETGGEPFFKTLINFSTISLQHQQQPANAHSFAFQLHCLVQGQDLQLSATFNECSIPKATVRLLLSDLEHVIWQLANSTGEHSTLADVQIMSPASQRHLVKLNRP